MKLKNILNFVISYVFIFNQILLAPAYANKYQEDAEAFVKTQKESVHILAKNAAVNQFSAIMVNLLYSQYSPTEFNELNKALQNQSLRLIQDVVNMSKIIHESPAGELDASEVQSVIKNLLTDITSADSSLKRLSWYVRDQMDNMFETQDWFYHSINAFKDRCSLGYFSDEGQEPIQAIASPPDFKASWQFQLNFLYSPSPEQKKNQEGQNTYGNQQQETPENVFQVGAELSLIPENYGDSSDIKNLTEAAKVVNDGVGYSGMTYVVGKALVGSAAKGTLAAKVGAATASSATSAALAFGIAAVAVAAIIFIVGSYKAYKEQKKWAAAEMYKFYHILDSDDFSEIYRGECAKFVDRLSLFTDVYEKYNSNMEYRASVDEEVFQKEFGQCGDYFKFEELETQAESVDNITEVEFSPEMAEGAFKYYQCATKVHGPKIVKEVISDKITEIGSSLNILREYLVELVDIASGFENDFAHLIVATTDEIEIDRLYKDVVSVATGVILNLTPFDHYDYSKSLLVAKLESTGQESYFYDEETIQIKLSKIDEYINKYKALSRN